MVQCVVDERLLPISTCPWISSVMIVVASSVAYLFLELLYNGFIHTKLRNRISTKSVENLVYVNTNMGVFYDSSHDSPNITEEDELIGDDVLYVAI